MSIGGATSFSTMDIKQETDGIPSGLLSDLLESSPALQRALNETKAQLKQKDLKAEFDDLEEQVVVVEEGAEVIVDDLDVKQVSMLALSCYKYMYNNPQYYLTSDERPPPPTLSYKIFQKAQPCVCQLLTGSGHWPRDCLSYISYRVF